MRAASLRNDLSGGLTAAVVALPLALAFGVSSGIGPVAGLYGAIVVGFFAAIFGGTPAQVSGPTGPMTVVMAAVVTRFIAQDPDHGLVTAFTVVMMAGGFQILFGLLRLGKYIILVPYPVISGFMSGVGVIIILLQLGPLLGLAGAGSTLQALQQLPLLMDQLQPAAATAGLACLALVYLWPRQLRHLVPPALAALLVCTSVAALLAPAEAMPRIGEIPRALPSLQWPSLEPALLRDMLYASVLLAGLGAIDSLLTSLVADSLTRTHHDSDRELIGQGIGNLAAGLLGALPGAGATMRTVVNINAGGHSRISGATHALILLLIVLGLGPLAAQIPHAVLAGLLIKVGIDIIDWRFLRRLGRLPLFSAALMLGVLLFTVFVDLITAVMIGVFVANLVTIDRLTGMQLDGLRLSDGSDDDGGLPAQLLAALRDGAGTVLYFQIRGPMSFGVARAMSMRLAGFTRHQALILDLGEAQLVGVTTGLTLEEIIRREQADQRRVLLVPPAPEVAAKLEQLGTFASIRDEERFASPGQALDYARLQLSLASQSD